MVNASTLYIAIAITAFILVVIALLISRKETERLSNLILLALLLVILGGTFNNRLIGYTFIGAGVFVSIIDYIKTRRKN